MNPINPWIIVGIVLVVAIGVMVALYFWGQSMQKKQMAQKEQMMAAAQTVTMPQILTLIADDGIFDELPTKGEIKAMVSGIYIVSVKNVRGKVAPADEKKKSSWGAKLRKKQNEYQKIMAEEEQNKEAQKAAKAREKAQKEAAKKITK